MGAKFEAKIAPFHKEVLATREFPRDPEAYGALISLFAALHARVPRQRVEVEHAWHEGLSRSLANGASYTSVSAHRRA